MMATNDKPRCTKCDKELTEGDLALGDDHCGDCSAEVHREEREGAQSKSSKWDAVESESDMQDMLEEGDALSVAPKKPGQDIFVRYHPTFKFTAHVYESSDSEGFDTQLYIVDKPLTRIAGMETLFRRSTMFFGVTTLQKLFIWSIKHPRGQTEDSRFTSALNTVEVGRKDWVRVIWDGTHHAFRYIRAKGSLAEPVFPDLNRDEILDAVFPQDHFIDSLAHPVMKRLQGIDV